MNEQAITATRTPEIIAGEIRTFTASMLNNIIEIGRRMCEAKELLPYGEFGKWITEATGYSSSTANNFMRLYQEYGADQGCLFGAEVDCQTFGKLSYSKALALLAVPKEERETVAAELDAEHLSTRELERALKERDEARAEAEAVREDAKRAAEDADRKLTDAQKRVRELESRPVEVAVERDEEAISKAAAAAKKEAETAAQIQIDKLKEKLNKAEAGAKKAEEEKEQAIRESPLQAEKEKAEEAAKKAEAEAEALRKKLAAAETGAGEAALLARMAQENFAAAMDRIERMKDSNSATAEKLLTGMERIAQALLERIREAKA